MTAAPGASPALETLGSGPAPWERQNGESAKAFGAFQAYRDAGPRRSLRQVEAATGSNHGQVSAWSVQWKWVERSAAWDGFLDLERRQAQIDAVREMTLRHIDRAKWLQEVATDQLGKLLADARDKPVFTAHEVIRFMKEAVAIERIALGEPDSISDNRHSGAIVHAEAEQEVVLRILGDERGIAAAKVMADALAKSVQKSPPESKRAFRIVDGQAEAS